MARDPRRFYASSGGARGVRRAVYSRGGEQAPNDRPMPIL
jgi:hypothetical protein